MQAHQLRSRINILKLTAFNGKFAFKGTKEQLEKVRVADKYNQIL